MLSLISMPCYKQHANVNMWMKMQKWEQIIEGPTQVLAVNMNGDLKLDAILMIRSGYDKH